MIDEIRLRDRDFLVVTLGKSSAMQQQLGDLEFVGELNIIKRQDHGMIYIDELINDWL